MVLYMGIDPGAKGAIAVIDDNGSIFASTPYRKDDYIEIVRRIGIEDEKSVCCLEKVWAVRGNGVSSMFKFGENFGWIQGVLDSHSIPYQLVPPKVWKAEFGLGSNKNDSISVCKRLFPAADLRATDRCRNDSDGMAEALLMAVWAKRHM